MTNYLELAAEAEARWINVPTLSSGEVPGTEYVDRRYTMELAQAVRDLADEVAHWKNIAALAYREDTGLTTWHEIGKADRGVLEALEELGTWCS